MDNTGSKVSGNKVVVGLTGKLDSCVAAFLLKKQGFQVIGVSVLTLKDEYLKDSNTLPKCHIRDLDQIKNFCKKINIPFYATDARSQFDSDILDTMISSRLIGRANSTCQKCSIMRMDVLFSKMKQLGADYLATGHYCKVQKNLNTKQYFIHTSHDDSSDQSSALAGVGDDVLEHLLLPLGELSKEDVLKIANKFRLPFLEHQEYREACFKKPESYKYFFDSRVPKSLKGEGPVIDIDNDTSHGEHKGIFNYSISQADLDFKGMKQGNENASQIVSYNIANKRINIGSEKHLTFKGVQLINIRFNSDINTAVPLACYFKSPASSKLLKGVVYFKNNKSLLLEFEEALSPILIGESFTLYNKNSGNAKVIASGTVYKRGEMNYVDRAKEYRNSDQNPFKPRFLQF